MRTEEEEKKSHCTPLVNAKEIPIISHQVRKRRKRDEGECKLKVYYVILSTFVVASGRLSDPERSIQLMMEFRSISVSNKVLLEKLIKEDYAMEKKDIQEQ